MDLPDFLLARIAEDEELARRAGGTYRWQAKAPPRWIVGETNNDGIRREDGIPVCRHSWLHEMEHIARWDPARVLAKCAADRRIVRNAQSWALSDGVDQAQDTLRLLALPYADHPDYRDEWRP